MKKNKKLFTCVILLFVVLIYTICFYFSYQHRNSIKTEISVLTQRYGWWLGNAYEYNGSLYSRSINGIIKYNKNGESSEIIKVNKNNDLFDYTIYNDMIYLVDYENGTTCLNIFDMEGNPIGKSIDLPTDFLTMIGVVDNYLIGNTKTVKEERNFTAYDMDNGFKETDIPFLTCEIYGRHYINYKSEFIAASYGVDGYIVRNTDFIKTSTKRCLAVNDDYFVYSPNPYNPDIEYINIDSDEIFEFDRDKTYPFSQIIDSFLDDNLLTVSFTKYSDYFFENVDFTDGTDKLKYHDYDSCVTIDLNTGEILKQHKFDKFERIIYIGNDKIITFKDKKYVKYSSDSFKKINEQDASEIKNDGYYIFFSCNNYIFIFDNNSGELINTIDIT